VNRVCIYVCVCMCALLHDRRCVIDDNVTTTHKAQYNKVWVMIAIATLSCRCSKSYTSIPMCV